MVRALLNIVVATAAMTSLALQAAEARPAEACAIQADVIQLDCLNREIQPIRPRGPDRD